MQSELLIKDIKCLVQTELTPKLKVSGSKMMAVNTISDAFLYLSDGLIKDFGRMSEMNDADFIHENNHYEIIDASGKMVFPSFCDPHTHLVYAGSREIEYIDKIRGLSYSEIAKRGGGILNSAKKLHDISENELFEQSSVRVNEIISMGTGAVEIKSGYGLNTEDELKMLRVIQRIKNNFPIEVKATFLGAHSIPDDYKNKRDKYVDLVINEMIPLVASEELADYIDVFCDQGFFTVEDTERIMMAGLKYGLVSKLHANTQVASRQV